MKRGDFIFVYGTLMRGERADMTHNVLVSNHVTFIGGDFINGKLFHIGAFPGVKTIAGQYNDRLPKVAGEVFLIRDPSVVAILDAYEGYYPDNVSEGLYDRIQTESFRGKYVWVYIYNPPVRDEQLIETGDWRNPRMPHQHSQLQVKVGR